VKEEAFMSQHALFEEVGDPTTRREHDFYSTPEYMTRALLSRIPIHGHVLECCAGLSAITNVLSENLIRPTWLPTDPHIIVTENEPYQDSLTATWRLDATQPASWSTWGYYDWIVSNPPFVHANTIVPLAVAHARIGVAMVLRLSWFEPTEERAAFLKAHPPAVIVLPRHDFRGNGQTDSVTSAWFVWLADAGRRLYGSFDNDVVTRSERDELLRRHQ
jgi:hypothetical protein